MNEQPTCGMGLAEHSALPARLAELMAAMAENLEVHQKALDLADKNARLERDAYETLAREQRSIAARLAATADRMAGYRDLPMARHDDRALSAPEVLEAFARFVNAEQDLLALLQTAVERDRGMLDGALGRGG